jgi:hypothetical protein
LYPYFVNQSSEFCRHNTLCRFSASVYCCLFRYRLSPETFGYTLYGLDDRVLGFDSRRWLGIFLFTTASRTALGPTQPPIQWVPGVLSLGVKRPWREADHSPTSSAEVKNEWSCTSIPQYVFMAWCLVKHGDNFTFTS